MGIFDDGRSGVTGLASLLEGAMIIEYFGGVCRCQDRSGRLSIVSDRGSQR
jgi:hypothetical protein